MKNLFKKRYKILMILFISFYVVSVYSQEAASTKRFIYNPAGKRDPMILPWELKAKEPKKPTEYAQQIEKPIQELIIPLPASVSENVKGIVYSEEGPLALIGDRIVKEGDEINSVRVVKINPGEIIFFFFGKLHKVTVSGK